MLPWLKIWAARIHELMTMNHYVALSLLDSFNFLQRSPGFDASTQEGLNLCVNQHSSETGRYVSFILQSMAVGDWWMVEANKPISQIAHQHRRRSSLEGQRAR